MKKSSPLRKIWNFITGLLVAAFVTVAILLAGVRLVGLEPYAVLSGSMEPTYHTGSLIYVKSVDPYDVEVGQPITFVMNEDLVVATHRVVEIDKENQRFYTKGDANENVDGAPVHFNNLIGVPVYSIPYLGYLANYIQSPPGLYVAIAAGAVLLILGSHAQKFFLCQHVFALAVLRVVGYAALDCLHLSGICVIPAL